MDDELQELRRHQYHQSRIPALDGLETFVADGAPPDPELAELRSRSGFARWYPVPGGHRVVVLYEGGGFNADRFTFRQGVWDHEHCKRCTARIGEWVETTLLPSSNQPTLRPGQSATIRSWSGRFDRQAG